MLTSGAPQMRQSEGNKTAKRLSAIWLGQPDFAQAATRTRLVPLPLAPEALASEAI